MCPLHGLAATVYYNIALFELPHKAAQDANDDYLPNLVVEEEEC